MDNTQKRHREEPPEERLRVLPGGAGGDPIYIEDARAGTLLYIGGASNYFSSGLTWKKSMDIAKAISMLDIWQDNLDKENVKEYNQDVDSGVSVSEDGALTRKRARIDTFFRNNKPPLLKKAPSSGIATSRYYCPAILVRFYRGQSYCGYSKVKKVVIIPLLNLLYRGAVPVRVPCVSLKKTIRQQPGTKRPKRSSPFFMSGNFHRGLLFPNHGTHLNNHRTIINNQRRRTWENSKK